MALATQCPHCHTTFKVAHDQLKLRSGLVRCGACKQIFNGIENLVAPDQASAGGGAAPEKQPQQPRPAVVPPVPVRATAVSSVDSASAPPVAVTAPEQASSQDSLIPEQSAINALEFIPVDDPETRTRILADEAEPEPGEAHGADQPPAAMPMETDEDPLTRMTLVDFSIFDEDMAQAAEPAERATESLQPGRPSDEIWPNTREEPTEPDAQNAPDETTEPASMPVAQHDTAADLSADSGVRAFSVESQIEAKTPDTPGPIAEYEPDTVSPDETASAAIPAHSVEAPAAGVDSLEYDEDDTAAPARMAEEDVEEPSFVTGARRRQRQHRALRIFMGVASILLFAAALLQGAYIFRSQLAARFPQSGPMLSHLCDLAGCQVTLPAQIEQVSIESNELQAQPTNKNSFTLSLLLHNRSTVAQAWPHIELTLNDQDGKALVRRVLAPREYLPSDKNLAAGIAARSEQPVKVSFELSQLQASDYRVYLFYP